MNCNSQLQFNNDHIRLKNENQISQVTREKRLEVCQNLLISGDIREIRFRNQSSSLAMKLGFPIATPNQNEGPCSGNTSVLPLLSKLKQFFLLEKLCPQFLGTTKKFFTYSKKPLTYYSNLLTQNVKNYDKLDALWIAGKKPFATVASNRHLNTGETPGVVRRKDPCVIWVLEWKLSFWKKFTFIYLKTPRSYRN